MPSLRRAAISVAARRWRWASLLRAMPSSQARAGASPGRYRRLATSAAANTSAVRSSASSIGRPRRRRAPSTPPPGRSYSSPKASRSSAVRTSSSSSLSRAYSPTEDIPSAATLLVTFRERAQRSGGRSRHREQQWAVYVPDRVAGQVVAGVSRPAAGAGLVGAREEPVDRNARDLEEGVVGRLPDLLASQARAGSVPKHAGEPRVAVRVHRGHAIRRADHVEV